MKEKVVVGFDIGTSTLKVTIISYSNGKVILNQNVDYKSKSEIAPGIHYASMYEEVLAELIKLYSSSYKIECIALSTHMYSLCEDTGHGIIVYQWNSIWIRNPEKEPQLRELMGVSGCPIDTIYPAYKIATVENRDKRKLLPYGLKEHLMQFLCGNLVSDYTCASASGLYNIYKREWNKELIESLGFSIEQMPKVINYNEIAGFIDVIEGVELNERIALVPGLGDGPSASYSYSSLTSICANIGTSMAVRSITDRKSEKTGCETWTYAFDGKRYITGGISPNSCSILDKARELGYMKEFDLERADKEVMFFPWLHGEKTPYWSSNLRGTFMGLGIETDINSINCAILKGVVFTLAKIYDSVSQNVNNSDMLGIAGGGINLDAAIKLLSGSIPAKIGIFQDCQFIGSFGAACIASEALGLSIIEQKSMERVINPTLEYRQEYENWLAVASDVVAIYEKNAARNIN